MQQVMMKMMMSALQAKVSSLFGILNKFMLSASLEFRDKVG